jgi:hypothetical protein
MKKLMNKKLYFLWFFIAIDFVLMFFSRESGLVYLLLASFGILLTYFYRIKNRADVSSDWRKVFNFTFVVGFNFIAVMSTIWVIETIFSLF